jgi:hypothetical protein
MYSEEQWEYIGLCEECRAPLYRLDDKVSPGCRVDDYHLCWIEEDSYA